MAWRQEEINLVRVIMIQSPIRKTTGKLTIPRKREARKAKNQCFPMRACSLS
jgi:hypothetical protein